MCYRIRQEKTEHEVSGTTLTPPQSQRLRPRLVSVAAVTLAAGLAAAAFVAPSSLKQPPPVTQQSAAPMQPQGEKTTAPSASQEQASTASPAGFQATLSGADDGVPTSSDVARTAAGGCQHEL